MEPDSAGGGRRQAQIAVVGAGWWAQGWHLPHLHANPDAKVAAIVEPTQQPRSTLVKDMYSAIELQEVYGCPIFSTMKELLESDLAASLDGVVISSPHNTHYENGMLAIKAGLHILMEKPMTTDVREAKLLKEAVQRAQADAKTTDGSENVTDDSNVRASRSRKVFMVNNSANWRNQTRNAYKLVRGHKGCNIGTITHLHCLFQSPLLWLFNDPLNKGWVERSGNMTGNGFGWGQLSHTLAWAFRVCDLEPRSCFAYMSHSAQTGADVTVAAVIKCVSGATISVSGVASAVGAYGLSCSHTGEHGDEGKESSGGGGGGGGGGSSGGHCVVKTERGEDGSKYVDFKIYGTNGMISFTGNSEVPQSGKLEACWSDPLSPLSSAAGDGASDEGRGGGDGGGGGGSSITPQTRRIVYEQEGFEFENLDPSGTGPESVQAFIDACLGREYWNGADVLIGLKVVATIDAMYRSIVSSAAEEVDLG